ncbi:TIGR04086 family membrane protein [Clostridium oceanicum]|uniref:TIGR04086 family membrane protein n=1 Tax=Clostridium oceanicum TaxID=1543 RepID=A0ABP3V7E0_9CLOT
MQKKYCNYIVYGILRAVIFTVIMLLMFAVIMTFKNVGEKISSMIYLLTTLLSIVYGTVYSSRKINKKGWAIGIIIALLYTVIIYIISLVSGNTLTFGVDRLLRIVLAIVVGMLSGMLGVNLKE